ncbi:MAG: isocitrate/isopropylmalate dehydrogenase family protein [Ruminococcaceae bacterium]|nr:isocitrate/isopropylmalate dehydrogenase family protein [Oscillospiraceae bacterium]
MNIENAIKHFRTLLEEQIARTERMAKDNEKIDFSSLPQIIIGVIGGDGIGPIITDEAEVLLRSILKDEIESGKILIKNIKGLTIENRTAKNQAIPTDVLEEIKTCHVLLKGPTTTPNGGTLESANVAMRRELDLFANVRPVVVPEEGIDWIFFRENTEGEYVLGSHGIEIPDTLAVDFKVITDLGTRRIAKAAFEYAKQNGKNKIAIITKANIMKKTDGKFSKICHEVAAEYPGIDADEWYVDIMAANLIKENVRSRYQVFVLPNLYGDILTDEAAQLQGGVGTAGSANIGNKYAMFEAIHGSAPRMIERGDADYANPSSMFKASEMLLRHIGFVEKAESLSKALENIKFPTDRSETCQEFGERLRSVL